MRHSVKTEILQNVLNYLANRPYQEVAAFITALQGDAVLIEGSKETTHNPVESVETADQVAS
jgi:hypothetical protein